MLCVTDSKEHIIVSMSTALYALRSAKTNICRVQDAVEDDLLKSNPERPTRSCKLIVKSIQWNDLSIPDAESRVITKGQSLLVLGSPGIGKTTQL